MKMFSARQRGQTAAQAARDRSAAALQRAKLFRQDLIGVRHAVTVRIGAGFDDSIRRNANHHGRRTASPSRSRAHFVAARSQFAPTLGGMRSSSSKSPRFQAWLSKLDTRCRVWKRGASTAAARYRRTRPH